MAAAMLARLSLAVQNVERMFIVTIFGRNFPPPAAVCVSASHCLTPNIDKTTKPFSIKDLIGDGYLYAVPKFRRTVERRLQRKFGSPKYFWKLLVPKTTLRVCNECGHNHEVGVLCGHCYSKINKETKEIQAKITNDLGLSPVEQEVVVLYEGEKLEEPVEFWKNKRIVEMPKARPPWFSKNLLQKTTQQPATTTDVKPTELA